MIKQSLRSDYANTMETLWNSKNVTDLASLTKIDHMLLKPIPMIVQASTC